MTSDDLRDRLVPLLTEEARRLASRGAPIPVEILAKEMGVDIKFLVTPGTRRRAALTSNPEGWAIVLHSPAERRTSVMSPRERFAVLHELGHYLVEREVGFRPTRDREYWQLERICDEFAADVLLPSDLVTETARLWNETSSSLIAIVRSLATRAEASLAVAARGVVGRVSGTAAVLSARELLRRRDARAVVVWLADPEGVLELRERAHIKPGHVLEAVIGLHVNSVVGEARKDVSRELDIDSLRTGTREILVAASARKCSLGFDSDAPTPDQ